jgi:hypothetical protein
MTEFGVEDPEAIEIREKYLLSVHRSLGPSLSAREQFETLQELRTHLGAIALAEMELGSSPLEAMKSAIVKFGGPEIVAADPANGTRRQIKLLATSIGVALLLNLVAVPITDLVLPHNFERVSPTAHFILDLMRDFPQILLIGVSSCSLRAKPYAIAAALSLVTTLLLVSEMLVQLTAYGRAAQLGLFLRNPQFVETIFVQAMTVFSVSLLTAIFARRAERRLSRRSLR